MKSFEQFVNEKSKPSNGNYYESGGDRYDGGVVFNVYVNNKKVHDQVIDGDQDYKYKGRSYSNQNKALDAIAKDNGLKSHKDFERIDLR